MLSPLDLDSMTGPSMPRPKGTTSSKPWESGGFCEARRDVGGERDGWLRFIEAGLNEAAVGPALWAEYLGALAATAIGVGDLM